MSCKGALDIVRYNWHFYAASAIALAVVAIARSPILALAAAPIAFWSIASLAASHYVYDRAAVTAWNWLLSTLPFDPTRWLNIHAGLDQSTAALRRFFPGAHGVACDIYDPHTMTEPSIARARRETGAIRATVDRLPFPAADRDCIFLLFAAHEIRSPLLRNTFFREVARVLAPGGYVVLVEHLRDVPNFIAFGPGAFHFHSRAAWLRAARPANLKLAAEGSQTPFVHWFVFAVDRSGGR